MNVKNLIEARFLAAWLEGAVTDYSRENVGEHTIESLLDVIKRIQYLLVGENQSPN
jgi:hypothetical protein